MSMIKLIGVVALTAVLATAGYVVGSRLLTSGGTEAQQPSLVDQLDALKALEEELGAEARFNGELLGIHIAPSEDQLPAEIRAEYDRLLASNCVSIPVEQAGALDFPRPLVMPAGYVPDEAAPETGSNYALSCGGRPWNRGWNYATTGAEGIPARVSIVRSTLTYDIQDVALSQVSIEVIGGREAVVIRPVSPDGLAQRHIVHFPESFGSTYVHTFNLSEAEVLKIAEAVAEASR